MNRLFLPVMALLLAFGAAGHAARAADPVPSIKPFFFANGSTRGTVGGHVVYGQRNLYSVTGGQGQVMTVTMTAPDDNAVFQIYGPGTKVARDADGVLTFTGKALPAGDDATRWSGHLPRAGAYLIVLGSTRGNARYSVDVKIE